VGLSLGTYSSSSDFVACEYSRDSAFGLVGFGLEGAADLARDSLGAGLTLLEATDLALRILLGISLLLRLLSGDGTGLEGVRYGEEGRESGMGIMH